MENDEQQSRYHKLEKPIFKSKIPPHLMAKLDDKDKWQLEMLAQLNDKTDWLMERALENNQANIDMDLRVATVERWKSVMSSKWAMLAATGLIVLTAFVSSGAGKLLDHLIKLKP